MNRIFENLPFFDGFTSIKRIVVLSGAGMSADSGLATFRDNGGLWEKHSIYEVATPEAWAANQDLVLQFYNERRRQLLEVEPNAGHLALAKLESSQYEVQIITQNVDDLHERAGSKRVLHLHGELRKVRSSVRAELIYDWEGWELKKGDLCEEGHQLRPHIVWFGEPVPLIPQAAALTANADLLLVVGSSLSVYPAAGLVQETKVGIPIIVIDPGELELEHLNNGLHIRETAANALPYILQELLEA